MDDLPKLILRRTGGIAYQLTHVQYSSVELHSKYWCPPINAYRCRRSIVICADLAGVDSSGIKVTIEPLCVWIRGDRPSPEPAAAEGPPVQVLALEVDYGPFQREIVLPEEIEPQRSQLEQRHGLFWIYLPLRSSG